MLHTHTSPSKKRNAPHAGSAGLALHVLKSVGISLLTALFSLFVSSVALGFSEDPASFLLPVGLLCAAITALVGGFSAVKLHKKAALICGLSNGCAMLAILLAVSLFFCGAASGYSPWISCLLHLGYLLLCVLGAFAALPGRGTPKKSTARRKRRPYSAARS